MSQQNYFDKIIHPMAKNVFFEEFYEKKPLYIARGDIDKFCGVLTLDDIDRLLATGNFRTSELFVINASKKISPPDFTTVNGVIDMQKVYKLFSSGSTILLNRLNFYHPPIAEICESFEQIFGATCSANIYITPPNSQGFNSHFDTHDTVILQLEGSKRWRLYGAPISLPITGHGDEQVRTSPGPCLNELVLHEGDALYIPRGNVHDACSEAKISMHATIGLFSFTWADLLLEALAIAVLDDSLFRSAIPVDVAYTTSDITDIESQFRNLARRFADTADVISALDSLKLQVASRKRPPMRGQFNKLALADKLSSNCTLLRK